MTEPTITTMFSVANGKKRDLSPADRSRLERIFLDQPDFPPDRPCGDCGGYHLRACPRVKREIRVGVGAGTGNRVEVEYFADWDSSEVIFPEDIFDDTEDAGGGSDALD